VKKTAVDVSYTLVFLVGTGILFAIGFYLFKELNSRETPTGIYNESSKICLENFTVS
jgi:fructose-specific phosphotransferase system IIC component